jgi:hypothetical protein
VQAYGRTPLPFEVNAGQTAAQVRYLSHGPGFQLFLTANAATFEVSRLGHPDTRDVFRLTFGGANPGPQVIGQNALPGYSNYFIGSDRARWHTHVTQYGQITYQNLYPGVDLVYHGTPGRSLEYDFVVAPGADPSVIRLTWQGLPSLGLDAHNNLLLGTAGGTVVQQAPVLYQVVNGVRQPVAGGHVLRGGGEAGFQVGAYDHTRPLVIDPTLNYSTYLGGSGWDLATGVAADAAGDAFVTGDTSSPLFPTTTGVIQVGYGHQGGGPGGVNAFLTKLNPAGTALVYSTYLGGSSSTGDQASAIAIDPTGAAYVTGITTSPDFPLAGGYRSPDPDSLENVFVSKVSAGGDALVYSALLGGRFSLYDHPPGQRGDRRGRRGERLRDRFHPERGVPDDSGGLPDQLHPVHPRPGVGRLREQAEPGGHGPGLLHLPQHQRR